MSEEERSEMVSRLVKLETAGFSDVLDEMGYPNQVLAREMRPLDPATRMAGAALCVRGENRVVTQSTAPAGPQISPYEIERRMQPDLVAVIDAGGHDVGAVIGGGGGTAVVLSTRGRDVRIGRGAVITVRLAEPLRVAYPR